MIQNWVISVSDFRGNWNFLVGFIGLKLVGVGSSWRWETCFVLCDNCDQPFRGKIVYWSVLMLQKNLHVTLERAVISIVQLSELLIMLRPTLKTICLQQPRNLSQMMLQNSQIEVLTFFRSQCARFRRVRNFILLCLFVLQFVGFGYRNKQSWASCWVWTKDY